MDIFSTDTLNEVVADLRVPAQGFAAKYFTNISQDESEEIHFDVANGPRRMAPFVSPLVAGKVVKSAGFKTNTFKPAYIKDKRVFSPNRAFKRSMGERIGGGEITPQQRMQLLLVSDLQNQLDMLECRLEWMATQALIYGAVTIVGDEYPAVVVDFGRSAAHTVAKTTGNKWTDTGINPMDDLQDWSDTMVKSCGVAMSDVIMGVDVWKVFRKHPHVEARLDRWRGSSTLVQNAHQKEGMVFQGIVDNFNVYTYSGWAIDPITGLENQIMPAGTVVGCAGDQVEGMRCHGAINDHDSLAALPYFSKSWLEQDPSVRFLLMQSAPLMVPFRPDATFRATVL